MFTVLPKIFALAPANRRFAEKNRLSGNTVAQQWKSVTIEKLLLINMIERVIDYVILI